MKKYILLAASLLATSTLADNFYLKGGVGLNSFTPFKVQEKELTTKSKLMHNFPLLEVGIGYNLGDRLRTELVYDYYFKFNNKEEYNSDSLVANVIRKTKINALFWNGYYNVLKFQKVSIFLGGGIGCSFHKGKTENLVITEWDYTKSRAANKYVDRFAHKITGGIDFALKEYLKLELSYNYFNLGKSKKGHRYKLHNLTLGVRYNV